MTTRRRSPARDADSPSPQRSEADVERSAREHAARFATVPSKEIVIAIAVAAAIGAAMAGAMPTGTRIWDGVLSAAMGALFALSASYCPRRFLAVLATAAAALVGWSVWLGAAVLGLIVAVASEMVDGPRRITGAAVGALVVQAFLRMQPLGFFGLPSIVAAMALIAILGVGYYQASSRIRRLANILTLICGVTGLAAVAAGGLVVYSARTPAEDGIAEARAALTAARDGDAVAVSSALAQASSSLASAESRLDHLLAQPLRLVPIVAQHQRALTVAVQQGAALATDASAMVSDGDVDSLRFRQGSFDLDALAALGPQLQQTASSLTAASVAVEEVRTPWLLPVVDRRVQDLADEIVDVLPEAKMSAEAVTVMPGMLGQDGRRRYLLLVGSPGETRQLGGFVGGYALIELEDGSASLIESGRAPELTLLAPGAVLDHPDGYPTEFLDADPIKFPQNLTTTPSIHTVARAARDMYPLLAGAPIDGVIYLDPYTIGAITDLTGPLSIEGRAEPLTRANAAKFFFEEQYTIYDNRTDSFGAIELALEAAVLGLAGADLPGPEELGRVLGPLARGGRLQIVTFDERENRFLQSAKLQRVFFAPRFGDSIALVQANASASKLDAFVQREVTYRAAVTDEGDLRAELDILLTSSIPSDAPEYTLGQAEAIPGLNKVLLSIYTPHQLSSVTVQGRPHDYVSELEFGFWRHSLFIVPLPANESARVLVELEGDVEPGNDYLLHVWQQPLVNDDVWHIEATVGDNDPQVESLVLVENATIFGPK